MRTLLAALPNFEGLRPGIICRAMMHIVIGRYCPYGSGIKWSSKRNKYFESVRQKTMLRLFWSNFCSCFIGLSSLIRFVFYIYEWHLQKFFTDEHTHARGDFLKSVKLSIFPVVLAEKRDSILLSPYLVHRLMTLNWWQRGFYGKIIEFPENQSPPLVPVTVGRVLG